MKLFICSLFSYNTSGYQMQPDVFTFYRVYYRPTLDCKHACSQHTSNFRFTMTHQIQRRNTLQTYSNANARLWPDITGPAKNQCDANNRTAFTRLSNFVFRIRRSCACHTLIRGQVQKAQNLCELKVDYVTCNAWSSLGIKRSNVKVNMMLPVCFGLIN